MSVLSKIFTMTLHPSFNFKLLLYTRTYHSNVTYIRISISTFKLKKFCPIIILCCCTKCTYVRTDYCRKKRKNNIDRDADDTHPTMPNSQYKGLALLVNSVIDGTTVQDDSKKWKERNTPNCTRTIGKVYWRSFLKRYRNQIVSNRGQKYELKRQNWTTQKISKYK